MLSSTPNARGCYFFSAVASGSRAIGAMTVELSGWDACIWAVGISSMGLDEASYAKVTEQLTLIWARALVRLNPVFSFCYCSAAGLVD
jgi:hypothetical protein